MNEWTRKMRVCLFTSADRIWFGTHTLCNVPHSYRSPYLICFLMTHTHTHPLIHTVLLTHIQKLISQWRMEKYAWHTNSISSTLYRFHLLSNIWSVELPFCKGSNYCWFTSKLWQSCQARFWILNRFFFSLVYKKCICFLLKTSKFWHKTFWDALGSLVWHKATFLACPATSDEISSNGWHGLFRKVRWLYCKNRCSLSYLKPRDLIWHWEYFTVKGTDCILYWEITKKLKC